VRPSARFTIRTVSPGSFVLPENVALQQSKKLANHTAKEMRCEVLRHDRALRGRRRYPQAVGPATFARKKKPSQITLPKDWQREILRHAVASAPAAQDD
jgi:hypothetical protein